ncbi:hypothetical protein N0V90_010860 [Kalmusia sp. IMI 367209]|nr:hypothetical protein N0V90_010860 [Kalmusia sp. IMI 367209]
MKLSKSLSFTTILFSATHATPNPGSSAALTPRESIVDTLLTFYRSLDVKSESLFRSVTTSDLIFDGTAFASIGVGAPEPMVSQDIIAPALIASLNMTTSHNLVNFQVQIDDQYANITAYVLAYHWKLLEEPRQNPLNNYLMSNWVEGNVRRENDTWKLEKVKLKPFFQSGNIEVMGLKQNN